MSPKEVKLDKCAFEQALHTLLDQLGTRQNAPVTASSDGQILFSAQLVTDRPEREVRELLAQLMSHHGIRQNLNVNSAGTQIMATGQLRPYNLESAGEIETYKASRSPN